MNRLPAKIAHIETAEGITLVDLETESHVLSAMLIATGENSDWLQSGKQVDAVFKETEVSIARNPAGVISIRNQLACTIISVEKGLLMSVITMQFERFIISSAITTRSVSLLGLSAGDEVTALIKTNEITLMKTQYNDKS